jgi:subtilase family serine protease
MVLDPDNKIVEADKTNNERAANITVVKGQNPVGGVSKIDKFDQQMPDIFKLKP